MRLSEHRFVAGTVVDLAQVPLGLAIRRGAPRPEISTVDAFRRTLLAAKSIASNSSAAVYVLTTLLPRLGIADTVAGKVVSQGAGAVASGESELVILPVSELLRAPGVDYIGTVPAEVQHISVFTAGILAGSKEVSGSKRLIAFLRSEAAVEAIRKSGMEPPKSR